MDKEIKVNDEFWKKKLTKTQFKITRKGGTETPFSGNYNNNKQPGIYKCICCEEILFDSNAKYDSGSGWPSFTNPINQNNILELEDTSHFIIRTEIKCKNCEAHLGHVFPDGPGESGLRYCINSISLNFESKEK